MFSKMKAKLLLVSIFVVWTSLILLTWRGWYQVAMTLVSIIVRNKDFRAYVLRLWISQDQDVNCIFMGNEDITISSRVGYLSELGSKTALCMEIVINTMFYVAAGQENHCRASIERDEKHYTYGSVDK